MASIHHNFGIKHLHGTQHHAKHAPATHKPTSEPETHEPQDSTASFTSSAKAEQHKEATDVGVGSSSKSVAPRAEEAISARPSFSNSPLKMGELGEVQGIDLNGPDRLGEAKIDGLNGIFSTKLVGLSGQTLANLNPLGH